MAAATDAILVFSRDIRVGNPTNGVGGYRYRSLEEEADHATSHVIVAAAVAVTALVSVGLASAIGADSTTSTAKKAKADLLRATRYDVINTNLLLETTTSTSGAPVSEISSIG